MKNSGVIFRWQDFNRMYLSRYHRLHIQDSAAAHMVTQSTYQFRIWIAREVVCMYSLHTSVRVPSFLSEGLVTKYWPLPTSAETPASYVVLLCLLSRSRSPEVVRSLRWGFIRETGRLQQVLVLHDHELLCFDCSDQTRHTLRRRMQN